MKRCSFSSSAVFVLLSLASPVFSMQPDDDQNYDVAQKTGAMLDIRNTALDQVLDKDPLYFHQYTHLTDLDAASNHLRKQVKALGVLTNLTNLDLSNNKFSDMVPLTGLIHLTTLNVSHNPVRDNLQVLGTLPNLTHLSVSFHKHFNVKDIADSKSLRRLIVEYSLHHPDSFLASQEGWHLLTSLTELGLGNNRLYDVKHLSPLTNLLTLNVCSNFLTDASPLSTLTNLTSLKLSNNRIYDFKSLSGLVNLTERDFKF